jgi:outer membrane protein
MKTRWLCLILSLSVLNANAQLLSVDDAIEIVLKSNYDILIAKQNLETVKANNTVGNAGMFPNINATVGDNFSVNNLNQKFTNGTEIVRNNVLGNNLNTNIALNWTVFDGFRMFITKNKLNQLEAMERFNLLESVQNKVAEVILAYYDITRQQQQLKTLKEGLNISEERRKIAEAKFTLGSSSKVDLLQAKVDANQKRAEIFNQENAIITTKKNLNRLLGRDIEQNFTVSDTIIILKNTDLVSLKSQTLKENYELKMSAKSKDIARLEKKEIGALLSPTLNLNAAYNYSLSNSQAGFILFNQSFGPSVGGTLNIPIFNGMDVNRQWQQAKINIQRQEYQYENIRAKVNTAVDKAMRDYLNALEILELEEMNISLAKENKDIARERFRLAQSSALELREAQKSYEDALYRTVNARFNAKMAEVEMKRISGQLIKK